MPETAKVWLKQHNLKVTPKNKRKALRKLKRKALKACKKDIPKLIPVRTYYLYALELEDDRYYVGLTAYKDAIVRYAQHCAGTGAKWTKLHKPRRIIETRNIGYCKRTMAEVAENLMTREYMSKYGMYKVRGGDLCYLNDTMVSLHYNDTGAKTILYDTTGKRIKKSQRSIRRYEKIQEQIASDLSWIC